MPPLKTGLTIEGNVLPLTLYEMTLIMWWRQKRKYEKNLDRGICGVGVSWRPPEASLLVALLSNSPACCQCFAM